MPPIDADIENARLHPQKYHRVRRGQRPSAAAQNQIIDGFQRQNEGVDLPVQLSNKGDDPTTTTAVQRFRIEFIDGDYLVCQPWDGVTDTAERVNIARPFLLRRSLAEYNSVTFTYTDDVTRDADNGSDTETQVIVPSYQVDAEIMAMLADAGNTGVIDGTDTPVEWIDINVDARAWAKQAE